LSCQGKLKKIINKFVIGNWAICVAIELGELSIFLIIKVSFDLAVVLPIYPECYSLKNFEFELVQSKVI
jgi:hypothetical protein